MKHNNYVSQTEVKYGIRSLAVWFEQKRNVHRFAACHEKGAIKS